jgi:hypothetical protein
VILLQFSFICQCSFGQGYCLAESTVNRYRQVRAARRLVAFVCLNVQELWRQCDAASAEYGTFPFVKTQRFGPPDILRKSARRP